MRRMSFSLLWATAGAQLEATIDAMPMRKAGQR